MSARETIEAERLMHEQQRMKTQRELMPMFGQIQAAKEVAYFGVIGGTTTISSENMKQDWQPKLMQRIPLTPKEACHSATMWTWTNLLHLPYP